MADDLGRFHVAKLVERDGGDSDSGAWKPQLAAGGMNRTMDLDPYRCQGTSAGMNRMLGRITSGRAREA